MYLAASRVKAKCDPVFREPLSSNRGHLAHSYFSRHLGLSWQMRWRQLFSQRPRAQPNQSKCQPYAYVWRADRGGQLNDTLNWCILATRDSLRSRVKGRNWHVDIHKPPHFTVYAEQNLTQEWAITGQDRKPALNLQHWLLSANTFYIVLLLKK